jgi:transposase-like protein
MDFTAKRFNDPEAAREYLEGLRWPSGPFCPHCGGADRQSRLEANPEQGIRAGLLFCGHCRSQYTVTVGTVFERSKIALHKWVLATHLMVSSKKGMSAHQLHRMLGITYKTAWFMAHRIREAMKSEGGMLGGGGKIVEADETYWGNARPLKTRGKKRAHGGYGHKNKVVALVERDGKTRAFHVADVTGDTLKPILQKHIAPDSHLMTDSASYYRHMSRDMFLSHEMVNHSADQYAKASEAIPGKVAHTNTVESFFGIFKRGLVGTYHHVSEAHLQRYCEEFSFRHSHRASLGVNDEQRAACLLQQVGGKRLTYRRTNAAS